MLCQLAAPGRVVHGLDIDAELLELAAASLAGRPGQSALHRGDMRNFDLDEEFDVVIAPHSAIYCLLDDAGVADCFASVHRHLAASGRFVFDAYRADPFHQDALDRDTPPARRADAAGDDDLYDVETLVCGGDTYDVFEQSSVATATQRVDVTYIHVRRSDGEAIRAPLPQRYLLEAQVAAHLRAAGFGVEGRYGSFDGAPLSDESEHQIWIAKRADAP